MFAALLFLMSVVALGQFGLFYWRALLASEAALPVSQEVLDAVNASGLRGEDFQPLAELHRLTPDLAAESRGLGLVPAYFKLIHAIGELAAGRLSGVASWAAGEETLCARYAAVQIERRLQSNLALANSLRSS